jgi:SAM-dependent methyltransferase
MKYDPPTCDVETQYRDASNLNARIGLHARFSTNPVGWMRWVFEQMQLGPGQRILEVGAGPGTLWQQNLDRVPLGCDITLTDLSAGMVEQARENLRGAYPHFSVRCANAEALPFDHQGYDVVMAHYMLYHVPAIPKALSEFRRVLKPGGRVFAATIGRAHLREISDLVRRFDHENPYDTGGPSTRFGLENGAELLAPFFEDVQLHPYRDSLVVTEPGPLVDYVASMMSVGAEFKGERLEEFRRFVQQEFETNGPMTIQKAQGMFAGARAQPAQSE